MKKLMTGMLLCLCVLLNANVLKIESTPDSIYNGKQLTQMLMKNDSCVILLEEGIYRVNLNIKGDVSIYGGFQGDSVLWRHGISQNDSRLTVLDGGYIFKDTGIDYKKDRYEPFEYGKQSVIALTEVPKIRQFLLDGCTVTHGSGTPNKDMDDPAGGGIFVDSKIRVSCLIRNCIIKDNYAGYGGGVSGGTVKTSLIDSNYALFGGGIIFCNIYNSVIQNNKSYFAGGGTCLSNVRECIIKNNEALGGGGSFQSYLDESIIFSNRGVQGGGTLKSDVHYSTFSSNKILKGTICESAYIREASGGELYHCKIFMSDDGESVPFDDVKLKYCTLYFKDHAFLFTGEIEGMERTGEKAPDLEIP